MILAVLVGSTPCKSPILASAGTHRAGRTSPSLPWRWGLRTKPPGWDPRWLGSCAGSWPFNSGAQRRTLLQEAFVLEEGLSLAAPEGLVWGFCLFFVAVVV